MRRQQLSEAQIMALFDPPAEPRELVRHYTLSDADLAMIRRCRGDHNRLGQAIMLCYLRYPGRPLRAGELPSKPLLAFVAEQLDILPQSIDDYLSAEWTRRSHAAELQDRLRLRPFGMRPAAELTTWLVPRAIEDERLGHLAELVVQECRQRRIVLPWPAALPLSGPVCGAEAEAPRQPLDFVDAIRMQRRAPLSRSFSRVTGRVPGFAALQAQCAQRLTEQRPFIVTQAFYEFWFGQGAVLRIVG